MYVVEGYRINVHFQMIFRCQKKASRFLAYPFIVCEAIVEIGVSTDPVIRRVICLRGLPSCQSHYTIEHRR